MNWDSHQKALSAERARQFRSREGLSRPRLEAAGSAAWLTWNNIRKENSSIRFGPEWQAAQFTLLFKTRHLLYQGLDPDAVRLALEIQQDLLPAQSVDDFILNNYCEEIHRDAGEPCDPAEIGNTKLLQRSQRIAEVWAVLHRWMELAEALAKVDCFV